MDFNEYQKEAERTALYSDRAEPTHPIVYATLGLAGEVGELANKVKKWYMRDSKKPTMAQRDILIDELGDVLWYVSACATELGIDLERVAVLNQRKLDSRHERGKVQGSGDNR